MTVQTASTTKVSIGTTKAASVLADFTSDTYVPVGEVESVGEFGDENNTVTFLSLADGRVRKSKGAADAGMVAIVCGKDPADPGQNALIAAQKSKFNYNLKVELADKLSTSGTNTFFYLRGLVMTARTNVGNADNVVRTTFNFAINAQPIEVPAT